MTKDQTRKRVLMGGLMALAAGAGLAAYGTADRAQAQEATTYTAQIEALNDSGVTGSASVTIDGEELMVEIRASGLSSELTHAQHIRVGGDGMCPADDADTDGDNLITTEEAESFFGDIRVSLTTDGDTDAESALEMNRFPEATDDGTLEYSRTFDLPEGFTAADIDGAVIVIHGIDIDESGEYDGDASTLDQDLTLEETIPAACGVLAAGATGGPGPDATGTPGAPGTPDTTPTPGTTPGAPGTPDTTPAPGTTPTPGTPGTSPEDPMAPPSAGSGGLLNQQGGGSSNSLLYAGLAILLAGSLGLAGLVAAPAIRRR